MWVLDMVQGKDKASAILVGFTKGMGSNVWVFKVQNGEYAGANEPWKPQKFCQTFQISFWMMSKLHNQCFTTHFLSWVKICKMGTAITQCFHLFNLWLWWEGWGHYWPHLKEISSRFILTITWSILTHLAWPRAHFDCTREGYKIISSKIH